MEFEQKQFDKLKNRCLYLIADCMRTEKNIREKIAKGKTKYPDELVNQVIDNLKQYNYINDKEFAKRFIELNKNKFSKKVIKEKLYIKGINNDLIQELLADFNEESEISAAKKALYKKCKDYDNIKNELEYKEKSKLFAFLARKGFSYETIETVMA